MVRQNCSSGQERADQGTAQGTRKIEPILFVDDAACVRDVIQRALNADGFETVVARDGHEAVSKFEASTFSLVLTDFEMPGMDGIELLKRLRRTDPKIPIVLISGNPAAVEDKAKEEGVRPDAIIVKPCDLEDLTRVVRGCTSRPFMPRPSSPIGECPSVPVDEGSGFAMAVAEGLKTRAV